MDGPGLLVAIGERLEYLGHRQRVLSQNIANADTPNYRPQDLTEQDFGNILDRVAQNERLSVRINATNSLHLPAPGGSPADERRERNLYEVAPTGNGVDLEQQLLNVGANAVQFNLVTAIYERQAQMLGTSISTGS